MLTQAPPLPSPQPARLPGREEGGEQVEDGQVLRGPPEAETRAGHFPADASRPGGGRGDAS